MVTGNNCAKSARTRGYVYAEGSSLAGLDLAETYPTKDTTLVPGEIVMLDPDNEVFVQRYSTSYRHCERSAAIHRRLVCHCERSCGNPYR